MILEIRNKFSEKIDYWFAEGNAQFSDWIVLLGHGVTGNLSRPVIALTARELNQAGSEECMRKSALARSSVLSASVCQDLTAACVRATNNRPWSDLCPLVRGVRCRRRWHLGLRARGRHRH